MIRRARQLLLMLFALFVAYLVIVRLLISWAQFAPAQFGSVVESVTQTEIEFQNLDIEQNWSGVTIRAEDLLVEHKTFEVEAERFAVDLNLFAPFLPRASLGDFLEVRGLNLLKFSPGTLSGQSVNKTGSEPDITMQSLEQIVGRINVSRLWKRVDIADLIVTFPQNGIPLTFDVQTFQAFKGANWTLASDLSLSYGSYFKNEQFQFKGSFLPNVWGVVEQGQFSFTSFQPLHLENLAKLLPEKWHQVLPAGELTVEMQGRLAKTQLSDLNIDLYAQALGWPDSEKALPKTLGVNLEWKNQAQVHGQDGVDWLFSANHVQLDNQFIETVAPIELSFSSNRNLHFSTQKFNIKPFKKMVHAILKNENVAQLFDASVELSLENIEGDLDVKTLVMNNLSLEISKLSIPVTSLPGLAMEQLYVDKRGEDFQIIIDKPFWVMDPRVHPIPMRFDMGDMLRGKLDQKRGVWSLEPLKFLWDEMPVELVGNGDFSGRLDVQASIEPGTMKKVKQYLPYSVMTEKLQAWLKSALVSGESIKGDLFFKGDLNDYPFVDTGTKFGGVVTVKNTHLKFQPKWPGLSGFDAEIRFEPYRLNITSDEIQMEPGLVASNVDVTIDQLHSKNIAVSVKGKVKGSGEAVSRYLVETPLPAKMGVDGFLKAPEKFAMHGGVEVDLQQVWIPVHGYAKQDERVSGTVRLDDAKWRFYNRLEFDRLKGEVAFTERSVQCRGLKGRFEGGDANIKIATNAQDEEVKVEASGLANADYPSVLKGAVKWAADVSIPIAKKATKGVVIDFTADTNKAQWLMPAPFNNESLKGPIKTKLTVQEQKTSIEGRVGKLGVFAFELGADQDDLKSIGGLVKVGGSDTAAIIAEKNKVAVNGVLDRLDLDEWMKWKTPESANDSSWFKELDWAKSNLKFNAIKFMNHEYPEMELAWQTTGKKGQVAFNASADYIQSVATLQDGKELNINVDRLKLSLPEGTFTSETADTEETRRQLQACKLKTPSVGTWPHVEFVGKGIQVDDIGLDKLTFEVRDTRNALHFKDMSAVFSDGAGELQGQYFFHKTPKQSSAAIKLSSKDVKKLTELLGLKQGFSGKKADLKANLAWAGGLECFDLLGLTGRTDFEIKDGVIEDVEPGFARLLGLLNVTSLARRLSLDLKDVTTKGMAYDSVKGKAIFNDGKMNLDGFKLEAPSAKVDLFGAVNLVERSFDLRADVTPALGSSLPALSALTGVATPLGALAIYALMKVIPDINEDLVTYKYDVIGPWAAPVIKEKNGAKVEKEPSEPEDILNP
ncbi:DUF3971 domain-containing protein [Thiomicrorhabdus sp. ZW0627]|uniref:YhdP family phospholipid transporter n=1 Tax=Thiomicrorhabdus sp. ZW0627 TaxID=3039774 RepID=UPI002436BC26|nr:DUF3971 domain-containing protein [Thiomicrorhabdus sp. ZW0627]MDG6774940.1 DUF3971 domain-containing protein [Thiomicrorhabdus sp. ZW0627]